MNRLTGFAIVGVSFAVAWIVTGGAIRLLKRQGIVDVPNTRSSHMVPTPRGGGVGIVAGLMAGLASAWFVGVPIPGLPLFLAGLLVAWAGMADDRQSGGLPVTVRLVVHFVAAAIVVCFVGRLERVPLPEPLDLPLGPLGIGLSMLWIVGLINLYNFLDGIDGFAALQGAIAGLGVAMLPYAGPVQAVGLAVAGACLGFLLHNWHPAKVFMGDVGAPTLGLIFASLPFLLETEFQGRALLATAVFLWFFLSDGAFTICRRLLHGEKIWRPHRSHLYQRLVQSGFRHDQVVLAVLGVGALLTLATVLVERGNMVRGPWFVLAGAVACFVVYYRGTRWREQRAASEAREMAVQPPRVGLSNSGRVATPPRPKPVPATAEARTAVMASTATGTSEPQPSISEISREPPRHPEVPTRPKPR